MLCCVVRPLYCIILSGVLILCCAVLFSHCIRAAQERIEAERVDLPSELDTPAERPALRFPRPTFVEKSMIRLRGAAWGWNGQALYSGCRAARHHAHHHDSDNDSDNDSGNGSAGPSTVPRRASS